jgi:diaminohydroxyphosphoribosylaminopyrimidine deaminase/5-amino-6-(5-phosphoribosylamino)uracil reductase
MRRALELARRGVALAAPNPLVGCVIVKGGRVVGRGSHTYEGRQHAEVLALERAGAAARGATLYVTLEPCCHTGRTGPCTRAIIAAGVRRVVAAMRDPNPRVSGRGLAELRRAGVPVTVGVREEEARRLNEGFACWIRNGRPLVTLKAAISRDWQIAGPAQRRRGSVTWITSPASRAEVQRMRHAADALVTGIGTVLADDPRLSERTARPRRRPLLRVVLDSRLRLPLRSKLVRSAAEDLLVFTAASPQSARGRALRRAGVEVVKAPTRGGRMDLRAALRELGRRGMHHALIEGGAELNRAALAARVVDRLVLFVAPRRLGRGVPFLAGGRGQLAKLPVLARVSTHRFGPDICVAGYLRGVYGNH